MMADGTKVLDLSGIGRMELEEMVARMRKAVAVACAVADKAQRDHDAMLANLTSTQTRCNELLAAYRASKFLDEQLGEMKSSMGIEQALLSLAAAIVRARELHPEGCNLADLASEVGEVGRAMNRETEGREREELLDTAAVAVRMWLGERSDRPRAPLAEATMSDQVLGGLLLLGSQFDEVFGRCVERRPDFDIQKIGACWQARWTHRGVPYELNSHESSSTALVEACLGSIEALDESETSR